MSRLLCVEGTPHHGYGLGGSHAKRLVEKYPAVDAVSLFTTSQSEPALSVFVIRPEIGLDLRVGKQGIDAGGIVE